MKRFWYLIGIGILALPIYHPLISARWDHAIDVVIAASFGGYFVEAKKARKRDERRNEGR